MVTAYDHPGAVAVDRAGVDLVLVGDSAANVVLGMDSTTEITLEEMVVLGRAVRRGLQRALMVMDLPFGSYEESDEQAVRTAVRLVRETGCDAVKLEGGHEAAVSRARAIAGAGILVMGHIGLTPQTATALGGFRAQGRTAEAARELVGQARALQDAGCFSLVLEAIPAEVAEDVVAGLDLLTIGIGAGPATDGQVLVLHDLLGIRDGTGARFVQRYDDLLDRMVDGVRRYAEDVRSGAYPAPGHTYPMPAEELAAFREQRGEVGAQDG